MKLSLFSTFQENVPSFTAIAKSVVNIRKLRMGINFGSRRAELKSFMEKKRFHFETTNNSRERERASVKVAEFVRNSNKRSSNDTIISLNKKDSWLILSKMYKRTRHECLHIRFMKYQG